MESTITITINANNANANDKGNNKMMTTLEEITMAQNGNEKMLEKIVIDNQGLIKKIANDYVRYHVMDFEDMVQNGNLGLMVAIKKFDPARNDNFPACVSMYANKFIRRGFDKFRSVKTKRWEYLTSEEKYGTITESLNDKIGDGETEFAESLASDELTPIEALELDNDIYNVRRAIQSLDSKEQLVIRSRFGIGCNKLKLKDLAGMLNCSLERVRQIEEEAKFKIKMAVTEE